VAIYYLEWYNVQVEGEEVKGFTLLKYMDRAGVNQLYWGERADIYITRNKDILLKMDPPIPVSSRFMGLPENIIAKVCHHLSVKWSFIFSNLTIFFNFKF